MPETNRASTTSQRIDQLDLPDLDLDGIETHDERIAEVQRVAAASRFAKVPLGYAVLRYDDVVVVHRDRRSHNGINQFLRRVGIDDERFLARRPNPFLRSEGPEHTRLRRLVVAAFTPKAIDRLRPFMRRRLDTFIDGFVADGRADLVTSIFDVFPLQVIYELLGAPAADWDLVGGWVKDVFLVYGGTRDQSVDKIMAAHDALDAYVEDLIEQRRRAPGNSLLDMLIAAELDGDRLSNEELQCVAESVILAGADTTRNQLGLSTALLLERPERRTRLRDDPALIPTAVEETLRYMPTAGGQPRFIVEDMPINDVLVPAGTLLFTNFLGANFDPTVWDRPAELLVDRKPLSPGHLTFGTGVHACLGAWLARAEIEEAIGALVRRLPDVTLDGPIDWRPYASRGMWGLGRLNVRFTPEGTAN